MCKIKLYDERSNKYYTGCLAALSLRLLVDFEPKGAKANELEDRLVADHMRVALSIPAHREYMRSTSLSEPILAEAASMVMSDMEKHALESPGSPLDILSRNVEKNLISVGEHGELVVRLLLTLAHDDVIRKFYPPRTGIPIRYSKPIKLIECLTSLFTSPRINIILKCRAENMPNSPTLAEAFKDAMVHFTHFGKAKSPAMLSDEAAWIAMSRGMAWQFYIQEYAVSIGIPILLWNKPLGRYVMTILVIQVENQKKPSERHVDLEDEKHKFFTEHMSNNEYNSRPYIVMSLHLGVQTNVDSKQQSPPIPTGQLPVMTKYRTGGAAHSSSSVKSEKKRHPRYLIDVYGCSSTVFGVIQSDENKSYEILLDPIKNFISTPLEENDANFGWCKRTEPSRLTCTEGNEIYAGDLVIVS